jgi:hypothetical protein
MVKLRAPMQKASAVKSVKDCWTREAGDEALANEVPEDLLQMIFDECWTRFLLTNVHSKSGASDLKELWDTLSWVQSMASLKEQKAPESAKPRLKTLIQAVDATLLRTHEGGMPLAAPDYVPLGSVQSYKEDLKLIMESFRT